MHSTEQTRHKHYYLTINETQPLETEELAWTGDVVNFHEKTTPFVFIISTGWKPCHLWLGGATGMSLNWEVKVLYGP